MTPTGERAASLYLSYDGLLDQLGASQILPYLLSLADTGYRFTVVSFEKPERFAADGEAMQLFLADRGIAWAPRRFTRGGALGKIKDLLGMYRGALAAARASGATIVHARGHPAAQVARFVQRRTGARFLFDFRGLWADERVDKGGWNLARLRDRLQYRYFKRKERALLAAADQIVVLTEAVVPEVRRLGAGTATPITVIPCCADFAHFPLATRATRVAARVRAGLPEEALVLGYLGSIGQMYRIDAVCRLFAQAAARRSDVWMLFITRDHAELERITAQLPSALRERIRAMSATREEVPQLLAGLDVLISFIQPSYARTAASPTRLAESFATGVPVIANAGVGDVAAHVAQFDAGALADPESPASIEEAVARLDAVRTKGGTRLRKLAEPVLGLEFAAQRYRAVYAALEGRPC